MEVASPEHLLSLHSRGHLSTRHITSSTSQQDLEVDGVFLLFHFVFLIKIYRVLQRKKKEKKKKKARNQFILFYCSFSWNNLQGNKGGYRKRGTISMQRLWVPVN